MTPAHDARMRVTSSHDARMKMTSSHLPRRRWDGREVLAGRLPDLDVLRLIGVDTGQ